MRVTIFDDFDLQKIMDSGQCFRCKSLNGIYRFITGSEVIYIQPRSKSEYNVSCTADEWERIWIPYFDLEQNYESIRSKAESGTDSFMAKAAKAGAGIRILRQDPWETLISFIISQRKSIPAIKKSIETLADSFGKVIHTEHETISLFPTAAALYAAGSVALSDCSLGYRTPYVHAAAAQINANPSLLDDWAALDDPSLLAMLKTIKGVGEKVANCIMLFAYGRTSCAPVDTWISKVIDKEYDGANPFPQYERTAGIMQQYVFYYTLKHKEEVQ